MTKNRKDTICMALWTHLHSWPDGKVFPCCQTSSNKPIGDLHTESLAEIWNNESTKDIRLKMINGEEIDGCKLCYDHESLGQKSYRNEFNELYQTKSDYYLENTKADGFFPEFKLKSWDFRPTNLCNLKCRTCGLDLSSSWFKDNNRLYEEDNRKSAIISTDKIWNELIDQIDYVENIYFAGGEPLITSEHYDILEELIERNRLHVKLRYSTNFSIVSYKKNNIFDLWKKFDFVEVGASIDALYSKGEYIRSGFKWDKFVKNRETMKRECPQASFFVICTLSLYNIFDVCKLHSKLIDEQLIPRPEAFIINFVFESEFFRIQALPRSLKDEVSIIIDKHIKFLESKGVDNSNVQQFRVIKKFMYEEDKADLFEKFIEFNQKLDKFRKEDFKLIFSEYKGFLS